MAEKETIDLRDLIMMIKENKKDLKANYALEFDCKVDLEDYKLLIKIVNYIINYIQQNSSDAMHISLNASNKGHMLSFLAATTLTEFPVFNPNVSEAVKSMDADLEIETVPSKFLKVLISFHIE